MAKLQKLWAFLDVPSGAIMGVLTGSITAMGWAAFISTLVTGRPVGLPEGVVTAYAAAVAAFAGSKMLGKKEQPPAPGGQGDAPIA